MNTLKTLKSGTVLSASLLLLAAQSSGAAALFQIKPVLAQGLEQPPPPGAERMNLLETNTVNGTIRGQTFWVGQPTLIDENYVENAYATTNHFGRPTIDLTFTPEGKTRFAAATRQNLNKQLAIIIQGHLVEAPVVRAEITGGKLSIDGKFTSEQAADLASKIDKAAEAHRTGAAH